MAVFAGARIRDNNVFGTTTNNPLTNVGTTLNSAALANLSAVAGGHAVLVLDPLRAAGAPEIVIVTAHTAAATSATITRGAYGTAARQHAAGTLWVLATTADDLIRIATSSTRPADTYEGQRIYETDTDRDMVFDGSAWRLAHNPPACRAVLGAAQAVASGTETTVAFTGESYDNAAMHDAAVNNSRLTFPIAGVYLIHAQINWVSNATGWRLALIRANGGASLAYETRMAVNGDRTLIAFSIVTKRAAGDFVELRVNQNSGGSLNVDTAPMDTALAATWVGVG